MDTSPVIPPAASRRLFVAGAAALALTRGMTPATALAQQVTANATLQKPTADQDAASLAARNDAAAHLTVEVRINGAGPFHFVVDTGAERSVMADNVAKALNLPLGQTVTVDGLAGPIVAPTTAVDTLSFGPFTRKNLSLPILRREQLVADGYLGLDAINGTRVTFDFKNHALHVEQPRWAPHLADPGVESTRVQLQGTAGHLRVVDCLVDSVAATAFIDTGAEVSVGNPPLKEALKSRNKGLVDIGAMTLTGVTGGEVVGEIVPVKRIRLQDLAFTDGTLVIADVPDFDNWHIRFRPGLLIGMDYLRQFSSVSIDYRSKEVRFELSLAPPRPTPGVVIGANA